MISREELDLIASGTINRAGLAIEAVHGRGLTKSELNALANVLATALQLVAERSYSAPRTPPPAAPYRERRHAQQFNPVRTAEIRPVTDEAISKARGGTQKL